MSHPVKRSLLAPCGRAGIPHAFLTLLATVATSSPAWATPPEAALNYRSRQLTEAEGEVTRAEEELGRAYLGVSGGVEVTPSLEYAEDLRTPGNAPTFGPGVEASAYMDYTYDQPGILLETIELLQAQERLTTARREGVRAALMAHTDLLDAQLNLSLEQASFEADMRDLEETEARFRAGEATETQLEMARLGIDSGRRSLEYAQRTLEDVTAAAARYGLEAPARFRALAFDLPRVPYRETLTYRIAELELRRAEALALQNTVFDVVEEVRLGTRYIGDNYEVSGGISLDEGRPGVGASARYLDRDPEAWTVTLSATLRLDDDTPGEFGAAARAAEGARRYLADLDADLAGELEELREEAVFAERAVNVSFRDLNLIERRIEELEVETRMLPRRLDDLRTALEGVQAELDTLRARREGETDAEAQGALDRAISDTEARLTERDTGFREAEQEGIYAQQELDQLREFRNQAESNLYRVWTDYLRLVDTHLDRADLSWLEAP